MDYKGVHKETFHQGSNDGVPSHWVIFYWPEGSSPASDTHEALYFSDFDECEECENQLQDYDDWCSSQEGLLVVQ
jgi:hypothetical protein